MGHRCSMKIWTTTDVEKYGYVVVSGFVRFSYFLCSPCTENSQYTIWQHCICYVIEFNITSKFKWWLRILAVI